MTPRRAALVLAVATLAAVGEARAQAPPGKLGLPMLGLQPFELFGLRPALAERGLQIDAFVVTEAFGTLDGGVRRGTDVIKALALGARAALIGRPVLWGLAQGGQQGVADILEISRREIALGMQLLGCAGCGDITRSHIQSGPDPAS